MNVGIHVTNRKVHVNIVVLVYVAEMDKAIAAKAAMDQLEETDIMHVAHMAQVMFWGNISYRVQGCFFYYQHYSS